MNFNVGGTELNGRLTARRSEGVNQRRVRAHNEKLVLSLLRRSEGLSKAEVARITGLSAQTISVISRSLENEGLIKRQAPIRGRLGQPSTPFRLDAVGAYSIGLLIGRRSTRLVLMDFCSEIVAQEQTTYAYPTPDGIIEFVRSRIEQLIAHIEPEHRDRVIGLGIGSPGHLWNWLDRLDAPAAEMASWQGFDLQKAVQSATRLPTFIENDVSCACLAENIKGVGKSASDFAYFFVGTFVGGGLVLDGKLVTGVSGNAAAFGSLPMQRVEGRDGEQLIDHASLLCLEKTLKQAGINDSVLWTNANDWSTLEPHLSSWLDQTADALAQGVLSVCSVIDVPTIVIDGAFPSGVRNDLLAKTRAALKASNLQGLLEPEVVPGTIGGDAGVLGASVLPLQSIFTA